MVHVYQTCIPTQDEFQPGSALEKKKAAPKKAAKKNNQDRPLWYPGAVAPDYLDGSLVGDYGFDPFGLGNPRSICNLIWTLWTKTWLRTWREMLSGLGSKVLT
ncbi:hypothetical protein FED16_19155 [Acinetobacter baumannii]|nr:hypothetical protein FED16_19155 [Acinetobacter baumannii]